jgi:hypothetical protein
VTPGQRAARVLAAAAVIAGAVAVGLGWLYLLRDATLLDTGPRLSEALPLQRLAHGDAQPLGRMVAAWLPAGVVAGLGLAALTSLPRAARAVRVGAGAWAVLVLATAASHAVTESEPFIRHLENQPSQAAPWVAALLVAAGSIIVPSRRRGRARRGDATPWDSPSAWAA